MDEADQTENEEEDEYEADQDQETQRDILETRQNRTTLFEYDHTNGRIYLSSDKKRSHQSKLSQNQDSI